MSDLEKFKALSWLILECKYCYYCAPQYKHISDVEYDRLESEYKQLALSLDLNPTASSMVGFDTERPSCKLVKSRVDFNKSISYNILKSLKE